MSIITFDQYAKTHIQALLAERFIYIDSSVTLTGQYALNVTRNGVNTPQTIMGLKNTLLVEIRSTDKDIRTTNWVKLEDLYQVGTANA